MSSPATTDTDDDYTPNPRRWQALAVCLVVGFMTLLDVSIVNVALPSIQRGLNASSADLSWVVSGYALTFGLSLVPAGRIGDARGRKTSFLVGLTLFTLASAGCGVSQSPMELIISRLIQGAAGGILSPQVSGLIQLLFRGKERGRAFGMYGSVVGISTAVGPLLGGLLIQAAGEHTGWRWVFFVNLPIGAGTFVAALRLLPVRPRDTVQPIRGSFDPLGVVLLGGGVAALELPLIQEQQWHGGTKWLLLLLAGIVLAYFVFWERHQMRVQRLPLIDLSLFKLRSYTLGCLLGFSYFAGFTTIFFIFTLYVQNGLHYTALEAGVAVTPFAIGSAISARIGGNIVFRYGRRLITVGLLLVVIGLAFTVLAVHLEPGRAVGFATAGPLLVAGIGSGLVISPNITLTLDQVPVKRAGIAGGVQQTAQRIGSAAGIALVGAVFFARFNATGDWAHAFIVGLSTAIGLVLIALILAVADIYGNRARRG